MGLIIDSSVFIAAERGKLDLHTYLSDHGNQPIALAAITVSELLHGVHRARTPEQRTRREAFVEQILSGLPIQPFDVMVARLHGRISAELAAVGQNIGAHDLMIATTALALDYGVATRDLRSFPRVPALKVLHWA